MILEGAALNSFIKSIKKFFTKTDVFLWLLTILAVIYGVLLISSMQRSGNYNYLYSQLIAIFIGYFAAVVISLIDYEYILRVWWIFALLSFLLIMAVFIFGINVSGTDDTAWIMLPGGISVQPSEVVKICFIITFSKHLQVLRDKDKLHNLFAVLSLLIHVSIPIVLIHIQGDDGTALIFMIMFLIMCFLGGLQIRYFLITLVLLAAGIPLVWNYVLNDEHKNRFLALFDLDSNALTDYGWQQYQGKVSIASGEMSGYGLYNGKRVASQLVPEQENDFILTVAGEELGFIGCIILIIIILLILTKIILDSSKARDYQGKMMCIGVFAMLASQSIINIGMVLGLLPVVGITLPFFSSGGTSMLSVLIGIGLVQSVYYHKDSSINIDNKIKNNKYKFSNTQTQF